MIGRYRTTIQVSRRIKVVLYDLKLHPREPYNDVIKRLLVTAGKQKDELEQPEEVLLAAKKESRENQINKENQLNKERPNRFYKNPTEK